MYGDEVIWAQRLSYRVPYCVDTEISPPYHESWCKGVYKQAFPQGIKEHDGV